MSEGSGTTSSSRAPLLFAATSFSFPPSPHLSPPNIPQPPPTTISSSSFTRATYNAPSYSPRPARNYRAADETRPTHARPVRAVQPMRTTPPTPIDTNTERHAPPNASRGYRPCNTGARSSLLASRLPRHHLLLPTSACSHARTHARNRTCMMCRSTSTFSPVRHPLPSPLFLRPPLACSLRSLGSFSPTLPRPPSFARSFCAPHPPRTRRSYLF